MRRIAPSFALLLLGCGKLSEEEFVNQYTRTYCEWEVSCLDPVLAVFDGPKEVEECEAVLGEEMVAKAYGCKLERNFAEQCLNNLSALSCEEDVPQDCELSWKKCALTSEDLDDES